MCWKHAESKGRSHAGGIPLPPRSIARHLTLLYVVSTGTLLMLASGYLYWALSRSLEIRDKALLSSKVQVVRSLLTRQPFDPGALVTEVEHEASESTLRYYLRVLDASGTVRFETPGMQSLLAPSAFPKPGQATSRSSELFLHDGGYLLATACLPDAGGHVIHAALDVSGDAGLLADYGRKLLGVLGGGLLFAAVTGGVAAWAGMRPLVRVVELARRISASQLHERIVIANWPAELMDLAQAMNAMFDRLQDSFSRLNQLSGDLAHELRTPISNLRGEAEVALKRCRTVEEYQQVLGSSLEECDRLSRMIDGLLFVARADDPRSAVRKAPFDARQEIETVREFYDALAVEQEITVRCEGAAVIHGDAMLFRRAVGNLLGNALRHTPRGGEVVIEAQEAAGDGVVVIVRDNGEGIPVEHLPHIFDRFYRVDPARSGARGGTGLGLAIVQSIAKLHGGTASIESTAGRGTTVTLQFPAGDSSGVAR